MQIVIDIPEHLIELAQKELIMGGDMPTIANAISNGVALPKGHGKLIDADELKTVMFCYMRDKTKSHTAKYVMSVAKAMVDLQKTIIEADKGE